MTARYAAPSVDAIQEDPEDESREESRGIDEEPLNSPSYRYSRASNEAAMASTKTTPGKERERSRRVHKSTPSDSKHQSRAKGKATTVRRASGSSRDNGSDAQRIRHRRTLSNRSTSSTSSSDEDEPVQDHRAALEAARLRLTSPSMISTVTSLTTSTNQSSGSSGSNSTITQASVTKRSSLGKRPEMTDPPMSPAVPDPPDVFAFLDTESTIDNPNNNEEEEEQDSPEDAESQWQSNEPEHSYDNSNLPPHLSPNRDSTSTSASASSSFHGSDQFSEPAADNDTDRSTSPERSINGRSSDRSSDHEPEAGPSTDRVSAKIAAQMAAAQQRQNLHTSMHAFGTPNMQRGNAVLPHISPTALTPRYAGHIKPPSLPRAEKIPVTGYELLASRLSSYHSSSEAESGPLIKPMYRKFGALNHRLLLHLQDEISELEEQLHRLDNADTQSRRAGLGGRVVPASRRAAAMQGGELQWHKTDVLGRIGFKLAQYNQALSSFNTTQSLFPPDPTDITTYRQYLHTEHPIADAETRFLDPADDLVSICSSIPPSAAPAQSQPLSRSQSQISASTLGNSVEIQPNLSHIPSLATAIAVAFLVPILTFSVIPGFLGRMTVVGLVAGGVVGALTQAGAIGRGCFGHEGLVCWAIYGGVMVVVAGIMG